MSDLDPPAAAEPQTIEASRRRTTSQRAVSAAMAPFLLMMVVVGTASAPAAEGQEKIFQQWEKELKKIERRLSAGNWSAAEKASSELVDEMVSMLVSGTQLLAKATSYRAMAEVGLGLQEDAEWHWYVAQNLDATLRVKRFPTFGTAGVFLESHRLRRAGQVPAGVTALSLTAGVSDVIAPVPIDVPLPQAPPSLFCLWVHDAPLEVEVVIDADGLVRAPVLLSGNLPAKIYLVLEAMREWRFQPARSAGESVAVLYKLTDLSDGLSAEDLMQLAVAGPAESPVHVGGDVQPPVKIKAPNPQYPEDARKARVQGVVIVQVIIDRWGCVTNLKVLKGLSMGLDEEAVKAMRRWRFKPATLNGRPVDIYWNLTVNFRLQ